MRNPELGVSREKDFGSNCIRNKDNKRNSLLASASCIIEKALLYARLLKYEKDFHLPDSKHMLHGKTGNRDTDPTAETKSEWFAAGFDQLDDIRIQTDCTHGEDDEELAECLQRSKYICGYAG